MDLQKWLRVVISVELSFVDLPYISTPQHMQYTYMYQHFEFLFAAFVTSVWQSHYHRFTGISQSCCTKHVVYIYDLLIILAIHAYYAGIMLNAFATYYARAYPSMQTFSSM